MKTRQELEELLKRAQERYNNNSVDGKPTKFGLDVLDAIQSAIEMTLDIERLTEIEQEHKELAPNVALLKDNLDKARGDSSRKTNEIIKSLAELQRTNRSKLALEA